MSASRKWLMPSLIAVLAVLVVSTVTMGRGNDRGAEADLAASLDDAQADWIGERVFINECNARIRCLTSWNVGEDFPSLGIGHFIWYRAGQQGRFTESFPTLLSYYDDLEVRVPAWLSDPDDREQPWPDRDAFLADLDGDRLSGLRAFLDDTRDVQARFLIRRLQHALPALEAEAREPAAIRSLFLEVANASPPRGLYALVDYVNFKGEGISASERYRGEGWGLLQVLEHMQGLPPDQRVLARFSQAAEAVLVRRVANAPPERGEDRWMAGWRNRVATYRPAGER
ncbi:MAG: hypothetical protein ACQETO_08820 [Pseudomonadota bacterium]